MKEDLIANIEAKFPKNGWSFIRTRKMKPFSYVGYMLTIYDLEDDITPIYDIKGRNLKSIFDKLIKLSPPQDYK